MPAGPLTFLYPRLARVLRQAEPLARTRPALCPNSVALRHYATNPRRHGKAVQPHSEDTPAASQATENPSDSAGPEQEITAQEPPSSSASTNSFDPPPPENLTPEEEAKRVAEEVQESKTDAKKSGPMETVLYMNGPPGSISAAKPHPPLPFSHYFDSYAMVNKLVEAGFERRQAIIIMMAIRGLLREKMAAAQAALVSKGDVDNVRCFCIYLLIPSSSPQDDVLARP